MEEKVKFVVTGRLIDHIGLAMYNSLPKAISELVANSYDNDAENVYISIPRKIGKNSIIKIEDDGCGMAKDFIRDYYMKIGINYRKLRKRSVKFNRPIIGSKGIGKLAGLGVANIMEIETVSNGMKCKLEIKRNMFSNDASIEDIEIPIFEERTNESNGTKVFLKGLLPHVTTLDEEELRKFFLKEFGLIKNFHIYVNGEEISSEDIPGERRNIRELIPECGIVTGYIIIAAEPKLIKKAGIVTKVRGRRVLGPTLFDINSRGHQFRVAERIYGEIEASFLDPEDPKCQFDEYIISTSRDGFNQNHPKFIKYKEWIENKLIEISRRLEKEQAEERKKRFFESREYSELLLRLPKEIRKDVEIKIKNLIESLAPKLNELSDKEADLIFEAIKKIIEAGEIVAILEKIEQASKEDVKKLSEALKTWGIYEINIVIEHFKSRLSVINKFEQLINRIDTLELKDIHDLLEKNLWLLSDEYRLYTSNNQIKRILTEETKYKKHREKRPDLIVKSISNNKLIIIELKRPSLLVGSKEHTQLIQYLNIIKRYAPNFSYIECYLIGSKFDESIRNPDFEKIGMYMRSYSEILQQARERYSELLSKLERG